MTSPAKTVKEYILSLEEPMKSVVQKTRDAFLENLPDGFEEDMGYGMIEYHVPLSVYPNGYCNDKTRALPFVNIAAQKHHLSVYHMGLYGNKELMDWFVGLLTDAGVKVDMGKGCFRFKYNRKIPYEVFAKLAKKISMQEYIKQVDEVLDSRKKAK